MKLINWTTVLGPKENDLIYTFQIISDIELFFLCDVPVGHLVCLFRSHAHVWLGCLCLLLYWIVGASWWKVKEKSKKFGLKINIQKTKIMTSSPITSWQIDGKTMETVTNFILGGSKITADDDCSHEIKRHLILGRKAMTNLDSILKSRDITLPTKVHLVKAMGFSSSDVWMWELDH